MNEFISVQLLHIHYANPGVSFRETKRKLRNPARQTSYIPQESHAFVQQSIQDITIIQVRSDQ